MPDSGSVDPRRDGASPRIAITGIACRLPGAPTISALWAMLREGRDASGEVPVDRTWLRDVYSEEVAAPGKTNLRRGAFLDPLPSFDHEFFGLESREQAQMDPQQKLMLAVTWEALEDAAEAADRLAGTRVGVFVGAMSSEHAHAFVLDPSRVDVYSATGAGLSMIANRVSYLLDFRGPSLAVETACSSSLTAIHIAVNSLRRGECDLAIVGGVNLALSPGMSIFYTKAGVASPDGVCRPFDASANGITRGEGALAVVLKREADAREHGSPVYAFVRGSALNQDGRSNGMTAPSGPAQQALLRDALADAGVRPESVSFVETHGTATPLGDTIESLALGAVLGQARSPQAAPLLVGSIKSNFGHLEGAAGIAGLVKATLALWHRELPPTAHLLAPNPRIPFGTLRLQPNAAPAALPNSGQPLFAGVSSFSLGGTNVHVVLESAPRLSPAEPACGDELPFVLSARSAQALRRMAHRLRMSAASAPSLRSLAATLLFGRSALPVRAVVFAREPGELVDRLCLLEQGAPTPGGIGPVDSTQARAARRSGRPPPAEAGPAPGDAPADLRDIARRWASGEVVAWGPLESLRGVEKLRAPTYPFEAPRGTTPPRTPPAPSAVTSASPPAFATPLAASTAGPMSPGESFQRAVRTLRAAVGRSLDLTAEAVPLDETFDVLGLDSILAVEVAALVEAELGKKVALDLFVQHPTVRKLAEHLAASPEAKTQACSPQADAAFERHAFVSADGLTAFGHLTTPPGDGPFPVVLVLQPELGGALDGQGRYKRTFEHASLTPAGFAVFTVDPRGAPGHGADFMARMDAGGAEVDDVLAAARYVSALRRIDGTRMAILGTSRGAYAAALAVGRGPSVFRAAILTMGFFDAASFMRREREVRPRHSPVLLFDKRGWDDIVRHFADPARDAVAAVAPTAVPLRVVHGDADGVVPLDQAYALRDALARRGRVVELESVGGMGHDIDQTHAAWPRIWSEHVAFLRRHLL